MGGGHPAEGLDLQLGDIGWEVRFPHATMEDPAQPR